MTEPKLRAFHSDKKLRDDILTEIRWHEGQDKIIQGTYGSDGKYCAVGCSINSLNRKRGKHLQTDDHSVYPAEFGIPQTIAHLEDRMFEGLDVPEAQKFPLRFMEAIKLNADLSLVTPKFMVWLLVDKKDGVIKHADAQGKEAIKQVASLYQRIIDGGIVSDDEWEDVADVAYKKMADKLIELLEEAPVN